MRKNNVILSFVIATNLFLFSSIVVNDVKDNNPKKIVTKEDFVRPIPQQQLFGYEIVAPTVAEVKEEPKKRYYNIIATGYCNCEICCGKKAPSRRGITASGVMASRGTIAVPKDIKLGTEFYIEGLEKYTGKESHIAYDRGGAIKRINSDTIKVDVWFPTHQEALKFGKKTFKGYIIEDNSVEVQNGR